MKVKIPQSKQTNSLYKQSQFTSLNASTINIHKHSSKHTKSSTNVTLNSIHLNGSLPKQKKILLSSKNSKINFTKQKQQVSSARIKKSKGKSKHKKSLQIELQNNIHQNEPQMSYRQYCLVQNSFIPIISNFQHKKLQQIMRSTADSIPYSEDFTKTSTRNVFPFKLKEHIKPIIQSKGEITQISKPIQKKQVQTQVSPIYSEIGIQYSQRITLPQIKKNTIVQKKAKEIDIQTDYIQQYKQINQDKKKSKTQQIDEKQFQNNQIIIQQPKQIKNQQSLSDLLSKLQFKHLPNEKSFQGLSKLQKQHYSSLLSELINKLNVHNHEQNNKVIVKSKSKIQMQEIIQFTPVQQMKIKYQKLQMEVYKRQCYQMNWMQKPFNPQQTQQSIDTSLLGINTFLFNFFCYIQINYSDQFLMMIKKQYGPTYKVQYQNLTRKFKKQTKPFKVLDSGLYEDFCQQTLQEVSLYEKIHLKAVFDSINDQLDTYRPFYQHNGEPFPWSVKMYNNICEYAFDQDSLQIIFGQIKQNLQQNVSNLCGIIINQQFLKGSNQKMLLQHKRSQRQNREVQKWLNINTNQNRSIQCEATKTLHRLSQIIYNQLLLEIINENIFFLNSQPDFQFIE